MKPDLTPQILGKEIGHALTGEVRVGLPGERLGAPQLRCGSTEARGGAVGTRPPAVVVLALRASSAPAVMDEGALRSHLSRRRVLPWGSDVSIAHGKSAARS